MAEAPLPTTGFGMFSTEFLTVVNNYNKYCQQQYLSLQMTDVIYFSF